MNPTDPRLAALYDIDNPDGPDHDHWRGLADRFAAKSIVDLGCGTGILTVTLAGPDRSVTGIDPDVGMLSVARTRIGTERVTWIEGDSRAIPAASADLVLMTGNVAQHIPVSEWGRTLQDIADGLRPGGVLGFETRNPAAEVWRAWQASAAKHTRQTPNGPITEWMEVTDPDSNGTVILTEHNRFDETGELLTMEQPLTFRSLDQLTADLEAAGLAMSSVHAGWFNEPLEATSPLLVIEATLPS